MQIWSVREFSVDSVRTSDGGSNESFGNTED
jgi:hypothetical protein